ncbi:MAG TPA: YrdB family protein [Polyangiales bacterium]
MIARTLNDVCRFALELTALYGFGAWGMSALRGWLRYALCTATVAAAVVYWGVLVAPKSRRRLRDPLRLAAEVAFFVCAASAFIGSGWVRFGLAFGAAAIVNAVLVRVVGTAAP